MLHSLLKMTQYIENCDLMKMRNDIEKYCGKIIIQNTIRRSFYYICQKQHLLLYNQIGVKKMVS